MSKHTATYVTDFSLVQVAAPKEHLPSPNIRYSALNLILVSCSFTNIHCLFQHMCLCCPCLLKQRTVDEGYASEKEKRTNAH